MNLIRRIYELLFRKHLDFDPKPCKTADEYMVELEELLEVPPVLRHRVAEVPHHVHVHLEHKHDDPKQ